MGCPYLWRPEVGPEKRPDETGCELMNCTEVQERLFEVLDGEGGAALRKQVEAHLADCADCRAEAEELRSTLASLADMPEEALPPELELRMSARLAEAEAEKEAQPFWQRFVAWIPALAGAGALAVALLMFGLPGTPAPGLPPVSRGPVLATLHLEAGEAAINGVKHGAGALEIHEGDIVELAEDGQSSLSYPGDILFRPRAGSKFQVFPRKLFLEVGKTWVTLGKQGKGFQVTTPTLACAVRGTTFTVDAREDGSASVDLHEGQLWVHGMDDPHGGRVIHGGERAGTSPEGRLGLGGPPPAVTTTSRPVVHPRPRPGTSLPTVRVGSGQEPDFDPRNPTGTN